MRADSCWVRSGVVERVGGVAGRVFGLNSNGHTYKRLFDRKLSAGGSQRGCPLAVETLAQVPHTLHNTVIRNDREQMACDCEVFEMPREEASSSGDVALCATYLKALGDPIRLRMVRALQASPLTVSDMAELLEMEMANVSHHLRVLYHADLVTIEKDGKYSYYRLNDEFVKRRASLKSLDFGCCKIDLRD